jgi:hypothetical protein
VIKIIKTTFIFSLEAWEIGAIFQLKRILHRVLGLPSGALDGSPNEIPERKSAVGGWLGAVLAVPAQG